MSAYLEERSKYFTFSEIQISPKGEMEVSSLFLIIKAKLPATALHHQEKKMNIILICYTSGQNLPWFMFILPGNGKDYENEFLQRKKIIWNQCHFAYSTESFRFCTEKYVVFWLKQAYSQPATDCGLIEGTLSTDTVVPRSISFNDTAIVRNFYAKKCHPLCKSKKLSKDFPLTWWKFAYDHFWL